MWHWVKIVLFEPFVLLHKEIVYWCSAFEVKCTDTSIVLNQQLKDLSILLSMSMITSQMQDSPLKLIGLIGVGSLFKKFL